MQYKKTKINIVKMIVSSNNYEEELGIIFNIYNNNKSYSKDEIEQSQSFEEEKSMLRASTAPARPLTDIEEFRRSREFILLEQAVICSAQLIQKNNQKYDLDSPDGQKTCKKYLKILEKIHEVFHFYQNLHNKSLNKDF